VNGGARFLLGATRSFRSLCCQYKLSIEYGKLTFGVPSPIVSSSVSIALDLRFDLGFFSTIFDAPPLPFCAGFLATSVEANAFTISAVCLKLRVTGALLASLHSLRNSPCAVTKSTLREMALMLAMAEVPKLLGRIN
jgi:hypothetical protein